MTPMINVGAGTRGVQAVLPSRAQVLELDTGQRQERSLN